MASATKQTEIRRAENIKRAGRRRKNREARKSTQSWRELFGDDRTGATGAGGASR